MALAPASMVKQLFGGAEVISQKNVLKRFLMRNQVILWLINTWGEGRSMRSYYFRLLHFSVSCVAVFFSPIKKPGSGRSQPAPASVVLLLSEVSYGHGTPRP